MIEIRPECDSDALAIEQLLDQAFGCDRFNKKSYGFRRSVERLWPLCLVAVDNEKLIGTIRFWPIRAGETPALLLGPIAVHSDYRALGLGAALIRLSLALAESAGHQLVVLVGDQPYYQRFGFEPASGFGVEMPGEDPARVLARRMGRGEIRGGKIGRADARSAAA